MTKPRPGVQSAIPMTGIIVQDEGTGLYVRQHWLTDALLGWTDEANCARVYESEAAARTLLARGAITGSGALRFIPLADDQAIV